ncbi:MAG: hypothetical protein HC769_12560 [Cyanobacteria bacterium CRU_2_1]|nr:hypothetical protein [Cyanobacteria bacterium RU_5_0]NJR59598.1 hypothetical protein [Cyanobacteria bacterium CRU_2_1]
MADVNGTWLGTYWQAGTPTRFEATFIQSGNSLSGRILDDNHLGEAQIDGEVVGRSIRFTKRYLTPSHHSVSYSGTLTEDANSMQGNWTIGVLYSGSWEAHRNDENLMADLRNRLEQKVPVEALVGG